MTSGLFEPTEEEQSATDALRERCQSILRQDPSQWEVIVAALDLRPEEVHRLLRRNDWTLPGALRIAYALGLEVRLHVQVSQQA